MGGNVFKDCKRIESIDEYDRVFKNNTVLFDLNIFTRPKSLGNKSSFGDLDVICDEKAKSYIIKKLNMENIPYNDNGNMVSYLSEDSYQIDIIFVYIEKIDYNIDYFSFADSSIIFRVMFKDTDYKHSSHGLHYVFGEKCNRKSIHLSDSYSCLLHLMDLNPHKFEDGFDDEEDFFEWVTSSSYFDASKFQDIETMFNAKTRKNVKKRKMFMSFMEYVKNRTFKEPSVFPKAVDFFYGVDEELAEIESKDEMDKIYSRKFNGKIVNEITGLEKRELGGFMMGFKLLYSKEDILGLTDDGVRHAIKLYHKY